MSFAANPRAAQPSGADATYETTGAVASDSLAAESLKTNGGFAENPHAAALGVRGDQSTLNTTDTSGARVLHPASSGAQREQEDALGAGSDERGVAGLRYPGGAGQPQFDGAHSLNGYTGGPTQGDSTGGLNDTEPAGISDFGASTLSSADEWKNPNIRSGPGDGSSTTASSKDGPAAGTGVRPHVPTAPNYTADVTTEGTFKPKGRNLDDADVTDSVPQTKTFLGDVGGVHDPGRLAEQAFDKTNASVAGGGVIGGGAPRTVEGEDGVGGQYGVLDSEGA